MSSSSPNAHPLVKAGEIESRLRQTVHFLNPETSRKNVCLSDMVGLNKDLGVHIMVLPPGKSGCEMHHHYCNSEWFYILKGNGKLQLAPCEMDTSSPTSGMANVTTVPKIEEHDVAAGDFAGFPGGPGGTGRNAVGPNGVPWAHTFVAGPEGLEYLVGGTRKEFDVCIYPLKRQTLLSDRGGARALAPFGSFHDVPAKVMEPEDGPWKA